MLLGGWVHCSFFCRCQGSGQGFVPSRWIFFLELSALRFIKALKWLSQRLIIQQLCAALANACHLSKAPGILSTKGHCILKCVKRQRGRVCFSFFFLPFMLLPPLLTSTFSKDHSSDYLFIAREASFLPKRAEREETRFDPGADSEAVLQESQLAWSLSFRHRSASLYPLIASLLWLPGTKGTQLKASPYP